LFTYGSYFENYLNRPHIWAALFHGEGFALILTKNVLGYGLGVFSQTNLVTLLAFQL
jgi:hypothetical protein